MTKKIYKHKCALKSCKEPFEPKNNTQIVCSPKCALELTKERNEKKAKQEWRKEKAVMKERLKTLSDWKKELEKEINHIARLIDFETTCISCGGNKKMSGGHYHSVGSNDSIRFNLHNIHIQDFYCNNEKSGNIHKYDLGLIDRYGKEYWEYVKFTLVHDYPLLKLKSFEYQDIIYKARGIVKYLKLQEKKYSPVERIELRKKFNAELGIYK